MCPILPGEVKMARFNEMVEGFITDLVVTKEYGKAKSNKDGEVNDFESYIDLIDSIREPKEYEWMSDIRIPEFISHILTQAAIDANQYFSSRDFVEVYLEDEGDEAKAASESAKECINRTLNRRDLYHYLKYMRGRSINQLTGRVYALCWWEKEVQREFLGNREEIRSLEEEGLPAVEVVETPEYEETLVKDQFNYDIIDPRNIFMDNTYVYSLQQKQWIIVRSEQTLQDLKEAASRRGYFNLDQIEEQMIAAESETSRETYNKGQGNYDSQVKINVIGKKLDILERFGKFWCIVKERDEDGHPSVIEPGYDEWGEKKEGAELVETISTYATSDNGLKVLIRFQPTPYRDYYGTPFKPLIRGLCYVHPTFDGGMGDGKYGRELQLALDDAVNIGNDRVMFATLPVLKTKRYEAEDNPEIYLKPGHIIPLETPTEDLNELTIDDDISGSLSQATYFANKMQQFDSIFPTTMGDVPGLSSTTATAVAGAESRTNLRSNYKSLTFENTFLCELYYMILNMTWRFAHPDTGIKLMGEKVYNFDPTRDYWYKPVSQSINSEQSKANKVNNWVQILGYISNIPDPRVIPIVVYVLGEVFKLMGDEYANFGDKLKELLAGGGANLSSASPQQEQQATSNEYGIQQSLIEQAARGTSNV